MTEKKGGYLPSQYAHLEETINSASARIQQIDKQIEGMPYDTPNPPTLRPSWAMDVRGERPTREALIAQLNREKANRKTYIKNLTENSLENASPDIAKQVRLSVAEKLSPSSKDAMELNTESLDIRQEYMLDVRKQRKDTVSDLTEEKAAEQGKANFEADSVSNPAAKFMERMTYQENRKEITDPSIDIDPGDN
jgi:hypothetical protein